jgi:hypothetical protein
MSDSFSPPPPPGIFAEIEAILSAMVDGELQEEQRARLSELLRGHAEAQAFYRDYLATHVALEFRYGAPAAPPVFAEDSLDDSVGRESEQSGSSRYPFSNAMILPSLQEVEGEGEKSAEVHVSLPPLGARYLRSAQESASTVSKDSRGAWRVWAVAAAIAVIAVVSLVMRGRLAESPVAATRAGPLPVVAAVSAQVDAKWSVDSVADGALRGGQHLVLTEGYAELRFVSGAKVVVQAPADFTLETRMSLLLTSGKLAATVVGGGFVVKTPSAAVIDLGTQFGVSISADRATRVEVFKGAVETSLTGAATATRQTLVAGQAADVVGNRLAMDPEGAQPQRFVRTLEGLIVRGKLVADLRPDLASDAAAWLNHASGEKSVGDFAPGATGRLAADVVEDAAGEKITALHLKDEATVALFSTKKVPADITQNGSVSVEAWIRPDAPLGTFNAVATWGEGKIGAQRDFLYGTITTFVGDYADVENWGDYRPTGGKWHYLVWVYRQESRTMTIYVDGQQVKIGKMDLHTASSVLTLGAGPDVVAAANFASRPLNGYLGAFRVETGLLTAADVQHNFERGMSDETVEKAAVR